MATDIGELLVKLSADLKGLDSGLKEAKGELAGFQNYASSFASSLKKALTFTVGTLGIAALVTEFKSLFDGVTEVGAKLELIRLATYAVGQNFGYTTSNIDQLVNDLKKLRVASSDAYEAVSQFMSHGLDPRQLAPIAQAARDLAVAAGKAPQEMFNFLIDSIVTGTPRALRQAKIPIKEFQDSVLEEGKSLDDNLKLSAQERSQVMIDLILKYAQTVQGVSESTSGAYSRQLGQIKYMSQQAKEALWEFMQPLLTAITGEKIKVWSDLLSWLTANRDELQQWGRTIGEFVRMVWGMISAVIAWVVANGDLVKTFIELAVIYKVSGYMIAMGSAAKGAGTGLYALAAGATVAKVAFGGWLGTLIQVVVALAALGAYKIAKIAQEKPSVARSMGMGEAEWVQSDEQRAANAEEDRREEDRRGVRKSTEEKLKDLSPEQQKQYQEFQNQLATAKTEGDLDKKVQEAMGKWKDLFGGTGAGKGGGGGGKAAKELNDDLLNYLTQYLEAKRRIELKDAEESYSTFKAQQDKKKAELDRDLAEGKITGQEYNKAMIAMAEAETAAALKLLDAKIAKEKEAYDWAQKELQTRAGAGEISPEALDLASKKLQAEHATRLKDLEGEAGRDKIKLQKELVDLQKQEYENRKQIVDTLAAGREEAALGPVAEKEAEINRLLRERQKLREDLITKGATPGQVSQFDATTKDLEFNKKYGDQISGMASAISNGLSSLVDSIGSGTQDLMKSANTMFKSIFNAALKPGLDQLTQLLVSGFKELFGTAGGAIGSAVMGVIGLVGMLLTSSSNKSFTSSGVQSNVTGHEAVRGIIAGETSIPIAEISVSLSEAMAPHLSVLQQIEANTRGAGGGAAGQVNVNVQSDRATTRESMEAYFREYLLMGAGAR